MKATLATIGLVLAIACVRSTIVAIPYTIPPQVDLSAYSGIHVPGFITDSEESNDLLVVATQRWLRSDGVTIVPGQTTLYTTATLTADLFIAQDGLIITGELNIVPFRADGVKARTREEFDQYGRRVVSEYRRYDTETGWALTGWLVLLDHSAVLGHTPELRGEVRGTVRPIGKEQAVYALVDSDIGPAISFIVRPTTAYVQRTLIQ